MEDVNKTTPFILQLKARIAECSGMDPRWRLRKHLISESPGTEKHIPSFLESTET
jgi:hypothetical protein